MEENLILFLNYKTGPLRFKPLVTLKSLKPFLNNSKTYKNAGEKKKKKKKRKKEKERRIKH